MPQATVEREALVDALAIAGKVSPFSPPAASPANTPQGMIRFEVKSGRGLLCSANFERSIAVEFAAKGDDISMALPLPIITRWTDKAPHGALVGITETDASALFAAGRTKAAIPRCHWALPPERAVTGHAIGIDAATLRAGLEAVVSVPKEDVKQPVLGGVMMHGIEGAFGFVATDSIRVHEMMSSAADDIRAVLPNDTARLLLAVLPNDTAPVAIVLDERNISFEFEAIKICSALMSGTYPQTADQFAQAMPNTLRARADILLADIELVATVADTRDRDFRLFLGSECIAAADSTHSDARGRVKLLAQWFGPELDITFALRPVRDALQLFGEDDVAWTMAGPLEPTAITSLARPDLRALVSPFLPRFQEERIAA